MTVFIPEPRGWEGFTETVVKARTISWTWPWSRSPEGMIVWRRLDVSRTAKTAVEFPKCSLIGPVRTGTMGRAMRASKCAGWRAVVVAVMAVRAVRAMVTVEEAGHGCNKWCSVVYVGLILRRDRMN